jgi:two-component system OmpR family sensor kinase
VSTGIVWWSMENKTIAALEKIPARKTLFWKLIGIFFWISCVGIAVHFFGFVSLHELYRDRVEQGTFWEAAEAYSRVIEPFTFPDYMRDKAEEKIVELKQLNPKIDVYLINKEGKIFFRHPDSESSVDMEPVEIFLKADWFPLWPIYGVNPRPKRRENREVPISVAPIRIGKSNGYVYLVLKGYRYEEAYHTFGDFSIVFASAFFFLVLVLFTTLLGAVLVRSSSKQFRRLTAAMQQFSAGDLEMRVEQLSDDEVGLHGRTFNAMANAIQESILALEEQDSLRRELIVNVSHDLRTPVGAMQLLLETLEKKFSRMTQTEQQEFIQRALTNCRELGNLVNDLFELSKLNANAEMPQLTHLLLSDVIAEVVTVFADKAERKNLEIRVEIGDDFPMVKADEKMLVRVFSNLIENAFRYSSSGSVVVLTAVVVGDGIAEISVSDQGIGIEKNELPNVFDRFFRGTRAKKTEVLGSGLGLAIVKRILELHQQDIRVESVRGEGTTFTFTLALVDR